MGLVTDEYLALEENIAQAISEQNQRGRDVPRHFLTLVSAIQVALLMAETLTNAPQFSGKRACASQGGYFILDACITCKTPTVFSMPVIACSQRDHFRCLFTCDVT